MDAPLIDKDTLIAMIDRVMHSPIAGGAVHLVVADSVLAYLRSVLTSEALSDHDNPSDPFGTTGGALHRRIFGEDV